MKLPKLTSKDMRYENKYGYDRLYSELTLTDTDWMNYKLTARFNTKYGRFFLSFEYSGHSEGNFSKREPHRHLYL